MIRIIKLYKYFLKSQSKKEEDGNSNMKKKRVEPTSTEAAIAALEAPESLFRKETDPSKLGKALSD